LLQKNSKNSVADGCPGDGPASVNERFESLIRTKKGNIRISPI